MNAKEHGMRTLVLGVSAIIISAVLAKSSNHCKGLKDASQSPQQMKNGCDYVDGVSDEREYYDPEEFEFVTDPSNLPSGDPDNPEDEGNHAGNPGNSKKPKGQCSRDEVPPRQICDTSSGTMACTSGATTVIRPVKILRYNCTPEGNCDETDPDEAFFNRPFNDDKCS